MKLLLVTSKKGILLAKTGDVLFSYDGSLDDALNNWLSTQYHVSVVGSQMIEATDTAVLTVVEKQHTPGEYITISKAIELVGKENKALQIFLEDLKKKPKIQLEYGVKDGKIVCITEVSLEHSGLKCECVCPGCGGRLQARIKGKRNVRHFAHNNEPCNLAVAQQTALHMLAKEIIEQEKVFMFPGYTVSPNEVNWKPDRQTYINYYPSKLQYREPYSARCEYVSLENRIDDFVPDIIVMVKGRECLVEIAVTHFVDEDKRRKIEKAGKPLVEVDLSSLHGQPISRDVIRDVLVNQTDCKTWIYNPLREEALVWAKANWQTEFEDKVKEEEERQKEYRRQEEIRQREAKRKEERRKRKRENATVKIEALIQPDNYKKALQRLRSDESFYTVLKDLSLRKNMSGQVPFFVDIPITGEMVFDCDRRIWQAAIFDTFIYNRVKGEDGKTKYSNDKIHSCVKNHMPFIRINWNLTYKVNIDLGKGMRGLTLLNDVVEKYLKYLCYIGFLKETGYREGVVVETHSLTPPNDKEAKLLEDAIKRCDKYNPLIDAEIEDILFPSKIQSGSNIYSWDGKHDTQYSAIGGLSQEEIRAKQDREYEIGYGNAQKHDFENGEQFFAQFGKCWCGCKYCGQIKRGDEMPSHGGRGSENIGVCHECYERRGRKL